MDFKIKSKKGETNPVHYLITVLLFVVSIPIIHSLIVDSSLSNQERLILGFAIIVIILSLVFNFVLQSGLLKKK